MRRAIIRGVVFGLLVCAGMVGTGGVSAQSATPTNAAGSSETLVLVEHSDHATDVDLGAEGPSAGEIRGWGPNPLYDADNTTATGAQTQGTCIALNADWDCVVAETIVFADGSTLQFQGYGVGDAKETMRTIIGGSGRYIGATGTAVVEPTQDLKVWKRTISIAVP